MASGRSHSVLSGGGGDDRRGKKAPRSRVQNGDEREKEGGAPAAFFDREFLKRLPGFLGDEAAAFLGTTNTETKRAGEMTGLYTGEIISWPSHTRASTRGVVGLRVPFAALFEANANGVELARLLAGDEKMNQQLPLTLHGPGLDGPAVHPMQEAVSQALSTVLDLTLDVFHPENLGLHSHDIGYAVHYCSGIRSITLKLDVAPRLVDEGDDGYEPGTGGATWPVLGPRPIEGQLLRYIVPPSQSTPRKFTLIGGYMPAGGAGRRQTRLSFEALGVAMGRCAHVCVDSACIGASSAYANMVDLDFPAGCAIKVLTIKRPPHPVGHDGIWEADPPAALFDYAHRMPLLERLILEDYHEIISSESLANLFRASLPTTDDEDDPRPRQRLRRIDLVRVPPREEDARFAAFALLGYLTTLVVRDCEGLTLDELLLFVTVRPRATATPRTLVLLGSNAALASNGQLTLEALKTGVRISTEDPGFALLP